MTKRRWIAVDMDGKRHTIDVLERKSSGIWDACVDGGVTYSGAEFSFGTERKAVGFCAGTVLRECVELIHEGQPTRAELISMLVKYGEHQWKCPWDMSDPNNLVVENDRPCTCGWSDDLRNATETP